MLVHKKYILYITITTQSYQSKEYFIIKVYQTVPAGFLFYRWWRWGGAWRWKRVSFCTHRHRCSSCLWCRWLSITWRGSKAHSCIQCYRALRCWVHHTFCWDTHKHWLPNCGAIFYCWNGHGWSRFLPGSCSSKSLNVYLNTVSHNSYTSFLGNQFWLCNEPLSDLFLYRDHPVKFIFAGRIEISFLNTHYKIN